MKECLNPVFLRRRVSARTVIGIGDLVILLADNPRPLSSSTWRQAPRHLCSSSSRVIRSYWSRDIIQGSQSWVWDSVMTKHRILLTNRQADRKDEAKCASLSSSKDFRPRSASFLKVGAKRPLYPHRQSMNIPSNSAFYFLTQGQSGSSPPHSHPIRSIVANRILYTFSRSERSRTCTAQVLRLFTLKQIWNWTTAPI